MSFLPLFLFRIPHRRLIFVEVIWGPPSDVTWEKAVFWVRAGTALPPTAGHERTQRPASHRRGSHPLSAPWQLRGAGQRSELTPLGEGPSLEGRFSARATGRMKRHVHTIYLVLGTALGTTAVRFTFGGCCQGACRILVPRLGVEPVLSAMQTRSLKPVDHQGSLCNLQFYYCCSYLLLPQFSK